MPRPMIVSKVVYNHLPRLTGDARRQARGIVWQTAQEIERDTKSRMEGPKHGRIYRRGAITKRYSVRGKKWQQHKGARARLVGGKVEVTVGYQFHRASAPGEAPAVDLGNLRASYQAEMVNDDAAAVFSNSIYAARLELGGSDSRGIHIAARPALRPAAKEARTRFVQRMRAMLAGLR